MNINIEYPNTSVTNIEWTWPGISPYMPLQIQISNQRIVEGLNNKELHFSFATVWTNPPTGYFTNEMDYRFYYIDKNGNTIYTPYQVLKQHGVWSTPVNYSRSVSSSLNDIMVSLDPNVDRTTVYLQYRSWIHIPSRPETTDTFVLDFQNITQTYIVTNLIPTNIGNTSANFEFTTNLNGTYKYFLNDTQVGSVTTENYKGIINLSGLDSNTNYSLTVVYTEYEKTSSFAKTITFKTAAGLLINNNSEWVAPSVKIYTGTTQEVQTTRKRGRPSKSQLQNTGWQDATPLVFLNDKWVKL